MTEKQFTDIEVGADTGRVRLYNGINFVEYSSSELLDLLNDLVGENEQLKEELEQCKAVIDNRWSEYLQKKELKE